MIPGRHINRREMLSAVVAGLLIGTGGLWKSDIVALIQGAIGGGMGMANTDLMIMEADEKNGERTSGK